jgi:hypothetical protein
MVEQQGARRVYGEPAMNVRSIIGWCISLGAAVAAPLALAHHATVAKFDDTKPTELTGIVTNVDWRNPHVHVFVNVTRADGTLENWAVELESTVLLLRSGWKHDTLKPGDSVRANGPAARDGSRQIWGTRIAAMPGARQVYNVTDTAPRAQRKPVPRGADGKPVLGVADASGGYWAYPTSTVLQQAGANVRMNGDGVLARIADAPRVAPFQPWALGLYQHRQQRHLADDPGFLNCKNPGAVRQFQTPYGVQFVQDAARERIFVLIGGGNRNYRIIYMDGRNQQGQVQGDDDNPLYYGRAVAHWENDTLVVNTTGFNEDFWFTNGGLPHTNQLSLVERFTRTDYNALRYEVTVNDPGAYTQPWSSGWELKWVEGELPVYFCQDNRS